MISALAGRPAAIVTFLDGLSFKEPGPEHCRQVGAELARLHAAGLDFELKRMNALGPTGWRPLFDRFAKRADEVAPGLERLIDEELSYLLPRWPQTLPDGVIHADLFPDNVFFLSEQVSGIIDFYFACNDFLAYDLAICLNAWCFGPEGALDRVRSRALFEGYQSVRRLEAAELTGLPLLARGAAVRFLLTRAHDWLTTPKDALVAPHDPTDYVRRLMVHQGMVSAGDYGLEC
jgi:homoserine kinase type II